jgi:hypothetical protein
MDIFQPIDPPERHKILPINSHGDWYTWSDTFRKFIMSCQLELEALGEPRLININGNARFSWDRRSRSYSRTFTLGLDTLPQSRLIQDITRFVEDIMRLSLTDRIMFLTNLIDEIISANMLSIIFACVRDVHTLLSKDNASALYAPLGLIGKWVGEFRLHADLYGPDMLFNVFEKVPDDDSGASTFLLVSELQTILLELPSVPAIVRKNIMSCFTSQRHTDGFKELHTLLHGSYNKWTVDLGIAMKKRQFRIKMNPGQGYIINDRKWLHGRERPTGGVPAKRLHRLAFTSYPMLNISHGYHC